jgi:hypothetical protein
MRGSGWKAGAAICPTGSIDDIANQSCLTYPRSRQNSRTLTWLTYLPNCAKRLELFLATPQPV